MSEMTKDVVNSDQSKTDAGPWPATARGEAGSGSDNGLDRDHRARVRRVAICDTKEGQRSAAEEECGRLTEEDQGLSADEKALGSEEHVSAIERSGWFPYQAMIRLGSRLAMMVDAGFWTALWVGLWWLWRKLYRDSGLPVPIWLDIAGALLVLPAGVLCARAAKGLGQHFAVTRLTSTSSVRETIDRQVRVAGRVAVAASILVLVMLGLLFFAPPNWSSWVSYVSGLVAFGANITLGLSAGVGGNAADILAKPGIRDSIECQLEMKDRTRRVLSKYMAVVLVLGCLFGLPGSSYAAEAVWVWAIDITDSMDPGQRDAAISELIEIAPAKAHRLGADAILIVKFSEASMLSRMTWIAVAPEPPRQDCSKVEPAPMVAKSLIMLSPTLAMARKRDAVESCHAQQRTLQQSYLEQVRVLREQLQDATRITPCADVTTRIVPVVQWLVLAPRTRAVDVVTDGVDHSGKPLRSLRIPEQVRVTFIMTAPNPKRTHPTTDEVLTAAQEWARVPGIAVTSVGEYTGVWAHLGQQAP